MDVGIILTYNCENFIENAWNKIPRDFLDKIILVDDESTDDTLKKAENLGISSFSHEHLGYGGNLKFGFKKAIEIGAEYIVEIHGDGQFDSSIIPAALKKMKEEDLDFLIGSRFVNIYQPLKDGMPFPRYLANIGLSFIEKLVLRLPFSEYHPGFRVYSKRFLNKINLECGANDYLYSFQIIALAAYHKVKCSETPVRADYKSPHTSVNYWRATMNSFQEIGVLFLYILARIGIKTSVFKSKN